MPDVATGVTGVPAAPRSLQVLVVDDDPVVASMVNLTGKPQPGDRPRKDKG